MGKSKPKKHQQEEKKEVKKEEKKEEIDVAAPANQNIDQSDKSNKPTLPKSWIDPKNKSYKPWARESKKSSIYVKCIYCEDPKDPDKNDILVESCYGMHSHQKSKIHIDNYQQYLLKHPEESKNESINNQNEKDSFDLEIIKFEYKFIQFMSAKNWAISFIDDLMEFLVMS